ncbi:MAG: hypothetical protein PHC64_08095 [Candidatus Gastranaerophilales bacterium]|nr:hypothetical protein [Candidatus Gastranaerophilales bacterium]
MGWFNKKFVYDEKIFDKEMFDIYKTAFSKRLESDYEAVILTNKSLVEDSLNEAILFVNKVKAYLS